MISLNEESNVNVKKDDDEEEEDVKEEPLDRAPAPVTPKMLIKALKHLRKKVFKGLFFTPREVTIEVSRLYTNVEQDLQLLLLEVTDKLICAAAAGLIGGKNDAGYYAFNLRQSGTREETRSELLFWLFYKKILTKALEDKKKQETNKNESDIKESGSKT